MSQAHTFAATGEQMNHATHLALIVLSLFYLLIFLVAEETTLSMILRGTLH
jgi:hypothetical protein